MRLLRYGISTDKWYVENFHGKAVPFYGILSHTWGPEDEEVTLESIQDAGTFYRRKKPSYEKLHFTRYKAAEDGLFYFWIDTCCIKRSDSTELQRSLNSMFYWYQRAARCYVYLEDVSEHDFVEEQYPWKTAFSKSKWFKRGWTLQELIAPKSVVFYSKEGKPLGDKQSLVETLAVVTGVPTTALLGGNLSRFSKQARLSWADGRVTKIPEDAAYSLIGIFGVTLPMFYADGDYEVRKRAALEELDLTIDRASSRAGKPQDVVRIGGACWDDLKILDKTRLEQLDWELSAYAVWLFGEVELPLDTSPAARLRCKEVTGDQRFWAEQKLQGLLGEFGVGYDHSAHYRNHQQEGLDMWIAPNIAKVQRLESAWHSCGPTAARTLIDLKVWLGKWKA
ncbi:hypothetical protein EKO04_001298 [Ascochyta lentis]|uniref:Heterokaryon incompatibility domain-containing protein n=1 Tax=Ascochyta lentis TaxID=205686 RepID=A0A8H7JA50_9PLEO|nr:hypothetical protein EKO04_001298 [Ascochyta lentis]